MKVSREEVEEFVQQSQVQYHQFPNSTLIVCCITLPNGFSVSGESGCADPAEFNAQIGQQIAYNMAFNKVWMFMGWGLANKLFSESDE